MDDHCVSAFTAAALLILILQFSNIFIEQEYCMLACFDMHMPTQLLGNSCCL